VTRVIDALDEQSSEISRFTSSETIMRIKRYIFQSNLLLGVDIFKIPNLRLSPTFLSERFVQAWTMAGLSGLVFNEVWSG
jgi:hypothetical protein